MREIAANTGGKFDVAPIKKSFRSFEKAAFRADPNNRFVCDNICDVVRGALVYEDMAGVVRDLLLYIDTLSFIQYTHTQGTWCQGFVRM